MSTKYDRHYAADPAACGAAFAPFVEFVQSLEGSCRILDLGCGQGRDALLFARAGHRVVGVDSSAVGIGQLLRTVEAEALEVELSVGDVTEFVPPGLFDVVVLDRLLHMLPSPRPVLERALRALEPGGRVLVSDYPKQLPMIREVLQDMEIVRDSKGFVFARRGSIGEDTRGLLAFLERAYQEPLGDYLAALDGRHLVWRMHEEIVCHAMWVERELRTGGRSLRTAYVELVATSPDRRGQGFASALMQHLVEQVEDFDIAALAPADTRLYEHLGWQRWRGPLFVREGDEARATPDEALDIYRLPGTPEIDLDLPISIEWRPGEVW